MTDGSVCLSLGSNTIGKDLLKVRFQPPYYSSNLEESAFFEDLSQSYRLIFFSVEGFFSPLNVLFRFVNGMVYYGLSLSSGEFGGSIYLNFVLTSLVEIPGNILVIHNCNRY